MGDSPHYRNLHTLLEHQVAQNGASPLFKVPVMKAPLELPTHWTDVSFSQFVNDVHTIACFLTTRLAKEGVPLRSTVAVWFNGREYIHFVYIFALSRASYIPQMFSDSLTDSGIVFELMSKGNAKAIVYDPSFEPMMGSCPYAALPVLPISDCLKVEVKVELPKAEDLPSGDAICFIYHTSGSTSGSPTLVPFTNRFISIIYNSPHRRGSYETQELSIQPGSVCHSATMLAFISAINVNGCFVQPSSARYSTVELMSMATTCGVNRFYIFSPLLSPHLNIARKDPAVLKMLQGMRIIAYIGVPLPPEDEDWGFENGIPLVNAFGSTECGGMMGSTLGKHPSLLKPIPSLSYRFELVNRTTQADGVGSKPLYEFVILSDSPNLPQPHLLSPDGNFRTGDLFEEAGDGYYLFRGRDGDWIKSDLTKLCDTKTIEDKVRAICGDMVKDCVVVGNGRPSPALFIEKLDTKSDITTDEGLKESILNRMKEFNDRRYNHERITDQRLIFIVQEGTLPRTAKGNLRRKAIEQSFLKQLDSVYASLHV